MASSSRNLLDVFTKLITSLECPICYEYVSSPIYQCNSGHILCSKCLSSIFICPTCRGSISPSSVRARSLEHISDLMIFPCRNEGCEEILPLKDLRSHEDLCRHANAFGGAFNENYKHTSLKHKLFMHVEEHIAPFFVSSSSVVNVDVGIQTECERASNSEASTSPSFPAEYAGPFLMYGIMQPATENCIQNNGLLPISSHQFSGFESPSSACVEKNPGSSCFVNNFTEILKKNAHLFNLSKCSNGLSTSNGLLGSATSSGGNVNEGSPSLGKSNLETDPNGISIPQEANVSDTQFRYSSSYAANVNPSFLQKSALPFKLSKSVTKSENNSLFFPTDQSKSFVKPVQWAKSLDLKTTKVKPKTVGPKTELVIQNKNKLPNSYHRKELHSPFSKIDRKVKSVSFRSKFVRVGRDSEQSHKDDKITHSSGQKKTKNERSNCFSFERFSTDLPKVFHEPDKKKNVFIFSDSNNLTSLQKLSIPLVENVTGSGNNTLFTSPEPQLSAIAVSTDSEQLIYSKEHGVHILGTNTMAARSCATSVTFSLNASISSPSASATENITAIYNLWTPLFCSKPVSSTSPGVTSITTLLNSKTTFSASGTSVTLTFSPTLDTSCSQTSKLVPLLADLSTVSNECLALNSFTRDESPSSSLFSTVAAPKISLCSSSASLNLTPLSSSAAVATTSISTVVNFSSTESGTSFIGHPFTFASTFVSPSSTVTHLKTSSSGSTAFAPTPFLDSKNPDPTNSEATLFKHEGNTNLKTSLDSCSTSNSNPFLIFSTSDTSNKSLIPSNCPNANFQSSIFPTCDTNFSHTIPFSLSSGSNDITSFFGQLVTQCSKNSSTNLGFNFGLNSYTNPFSSSLPNYTFSDRSKTVYGSSDDIFVFGNSSTPF